MDIDLKLALTLIAMLFSAVALIGYGWWRESKIDTLPRKTLEERKAQAFTASIKPVTTKQRIS